LQLRQRDLSTSPVARKGNLSWYGFLWSTIKELRPTFSFTLLYVDVSIFIRLGGGLSHTVQEAGIHQQWCVALQPRRPLSEGEWCSTSQYTLSKCSFPAYIIVLNFVCHHQHQGLDLMTYSVSADDHENPLIDSEGSSEHKHMQRLLYTSSKSGRESV
jgi:hypothetical protein